MSMAGEHVRVGELSLRCMASVQKVRGGEQYYIAWIFAEGQAYRLIIMKNGVIKGL